MNNSFYIIDVGHGNCSILVDSGEVAIFDTGSGSSLLEFLQSESIFKIDTVFISHADADHIGGLVQLISCGLFEIRNVYLNTDSLKNTKVWDDLLYVLDELFKDKKLNFEVSLTEDNSGRFTCGKFKIDIVAPSRYLAGKGPGSLDRNKDKITHNSISAVFRISFDDEPYFFIVSDLDEIGLNDITRRDSKLDSPILIFPHHGGNIPSSNLIGFSTELLQLVNPTTVIFSIGRGMHGTPKPEIVNLIKKLNPKTNIMCTQLSEHCTESITEYDQKYLNNVFSQGHKDGKCCAGTILIKLKNTLEISPSELEFLQFKKAVAKEALCLSD